MYRYGILKEVDTEWQCVGAGSGRIRNYLQDPDPQFEFRIRIRKGSGFGMDPELDFCLQPEFSTNNNVYLL